jgi:two-component system osmolarity sensor histidine kinase EnvZ
VTPATPATSHGHSGLLSLFLPRTLLWQTFTLIALLVVLALAAWSQIFRYFEEVPRARSLSQMVVSVVNLTRTALLNAETGRRQELLIDLAALEGIRIYPAEATDRLEPLPDERIMRLIIRDVRRQLGAETRFAGAWEGLPGFWVSFHLEPEDPDQYWVLLPAERLQQTSPLEWMGWTAAALLLALAGAYLIVSRVGRPLSSVAGAARMVGRGETPAQLPEDGPEEIAEVASAINQMAGDLARLDADRRLILAGVSHDLRTPLARLRLGVEMSGAPAADIEAMGTDIEEMDRIIGQFLDFGRDEADPAMQPLDLAALVREVSDNYRRRGLPLQVDLPEALLLPGRPLAIRRALTNLIDNALRYAGEDRTIDITLAVHAAEAVLEVADRGPGIPEHEAERMKHPFTRLDAARSNTKGSGLGLAIVDRIMKRLGGRLDLLPRAGGGLRACLVFPQEPSRKPERQARIRTSPAPDAGS